MTGKKACLLGCAAALLVVIGVVAVIIGLLVYVSQDVEGVAVSVQAPLDVRVGETFDLAVQVTNQRSGKVLKLSDIDVADEYLAGFTVLATEPAYKSSMHVPIDNSQRFTFATPISAGETQVFVFSLRAEKSGIFRGDIDICEGARFISTMAQTRVTAESGN